MRGDVVPVDGVHVSGHVIDRVVDCLNQGGVIGYPTETVYGLGGDAGDGDVIERIYRMKGRDFRKPLPVLVNRTEDVRGLVEDIPEKAGILMARFWPGPLTLVFEAFSSLPETLMGGSGRLGVRVSPDPVCRALLERFRRPLVSTSANPAGREPAESASAVLDYFGTEVDLILDGGVRRSTVFSTVLDVTEDPPRLLRRGGVPREAIENLVGAVHEIETA